MVSDDDSEIWRRLKYPPSSFDSAKKSFILLDKEEVKLALSAQCEEVNEVPTKTLVVIRTTEDMKKKFSGYLFLTTDRIVFASDRGSFSSSYRAKFALPYEEIASLRTGKYLFSTFVELTTQSGQIFRLMSFQNREITSELELVSKIKEFSRQKLKRKENEAKRERVHFTLDFSFLRPLAEKGLILQALTCPHCGGKIDELPNVGNLFQCRYCGDKIYATDVYREINRLLGYAVEQINSKTPFESEISPSVPQNPDQYTILQSNSEFHLAYDKNANPVYDFVVLVRIQCNKTNADVIKIECEAMNTDLKRVIKSKSLVLDLGDVQTINFSFSHIELNGKNLKSYEIGYPRNICNWKD
jgi:hypothetical protein